METGLLYVVFNKTIRDPETNEVLYKIGITENTVSERYYDFDLKMPGKIEMLFAYEFKDFKKTEKAEKAIHILLDKYRENGEWFKLNQNELDIIKTNCELMDGNLVTYEIKNEKEVKGVSENDVTDENKSSLLIQSHILYSTNAINPTKPCKIFLFPIQNALSGGRSVYDATRHAWTITRNYKNVSEYEFAAGLEKGISKGSYRITEWIDLHGNKCEFNGIEISDFTGFSWFKQINIGYWNYGNHLVVEFDGNGKFRLLRPNKENEWINCI